MGDAYEATNELPDFLHDEETESLKRSYKKKKRDRNKSRLKSSAEDFDPQSQTRKRKRTISSKLKASTIAEYVPLKRPRGRPPLNLTLNTASSSTFSAPIRLINKTHSRNPDIPQVPLLLPTTQAATQKPSKNSTDPADNEVAKVLRPHSALVTQRILSRLMTEGPLSIADFLTAGPEAPPRDLIQSILDILQVTAVIVQLKWKDPKNGMSSSSSSGSGSLNGNTTTYSMAGLAKGSEYVELSNIAKVTRKKMLCAAAARIRIEKLQVTPNILSQQHYTIQIQIEIICLYLYLNKQTGDCSMWQRGATARKNSNVALSFIRILYD